MTWEINASAEDLVGYVTGSLTVDMNPETNSSSAVLLASGQYSNPQLFNATSICVTQAKNTSQIIIRVRAARSSIGAMKGDHHVFRYQRGLRILLIPYKWT
jgi:hypothetical protein